MKNRIRLVCTITAALALCGAVGAMGHPEIECACSAEKLEARIAELEKKANVEKDLAAGRRTDDLRSGRVLGGMLVVGGGIGGYGQYIAAVRDVRRQLKRSGGYTDDVRAIDNSFKRKTAMSIRLNRTQLAGDWYMALSSYLNPKRTPSSPSKLSPSP